MKYHTVYKVTDPISGKYYIGKHTTTNLNDSYKGSGDWIRKGNINKEKLKKEILCIVESEEEAYEMEEKIVSKHLNNTFNMNKMIGGFGFDSRPKSEEHKRKIGLSNKKPKTGKALLACINNFKKASEINKGKKRPKKTKELISKANKKYWSKLKNRPWQKKTYIIEGKEYLGLEEIMKTYNITMQTIYYRIKSDNFTEWTNKGGFKNGRC